MIPRVAGSGQSFTGAGLYYLNDKRQADDATPDGKAASAFDKVGDYALNDKGERQTAYRVGFTSILNMEARSPDEAIAHMTASYERYREKEARKRGRKLEKPVYVYSLAWSPDQNPTQEEMLGAAHSSIKALRLEGLQTLIVQHTDEPHPHVHVIVNRIEQDGSRARNIPFDHLRFSRWAEQYERDHGGVLCDQRVRNNALRAQGIMVRDNVSLTRAEYTARERAQKSERDRWWAKQEQFRKQQQKQQKADLWARQLEERNALEDQTKARVASGHSVAKAEFRSRWRDLYKRQTDEAGRVETACGNGIFDRAVFVFTHRDLLAKGGAMRLRDIARMSLSSKALKTRVNKVHRAERSELGRLERSMAAGSVRLAWRDHRDAFARMEARQKLEQDALIHNHRQEWNRITADTKREAAVKPPELGPGSNISPKDIQRTIDGQPSLRGTYQTQARKDAGAGQQKKEALRKELKRRRRLDRDRDRGWER